MSVSPETVPTPRGAAASRFESPAARLLILALLVLLLQIPASMVQGMVSERQARESAAAEDVRAKWSGAQVLTGPLLRVPFVTRERRTDSEGRTVEDVTRDTAYFLPARLGLEAQVITELRSRGIYRIPVYRTRLRLTGRFDPPDFQDWPVRGSDIDWSQAELMIGLTEPRGLDADARLVWSGQALPIRPSSGTAGTWTPAGIHAPLGAALGTALGHGGSDFSIELGVNGSGQIMFTPTAEHTEVSLQSNWPHPGFQGNWLPVERRIDTEGFRARWSVSHLGRDYPQRWRETGEAQEAIAPSAFGVSLADPVNHYALADRICKYAIMVLIFTFAVVWLTEVLSGLRAHAIQYGLIGGALCLFGLLQLSFAEHFGFTVAFCVAALSVVILVTLYTRAVLRRTGRALAVGAVLSSLYAYLYMILQAEDYALLGGTVALFLGLSTVMYLTRRIDWFKAGSSPPSGAPGP